MRGTGHKRLPEFIEEEYISAIETLLSHSVYPKYNIEICRISQNEEKEFGYDGVITSLVPFFIQFKTSIFHTPEFRGKTATDRAGFGFNKKRGFFSFSLHRDKNSKRYEQHNALYMLSKHAKAAYVAPLFYKRTKLSEIKYKKVLFPWRYEKIVVNINYHSPIVFDNVRVLLESITLPPHAEIDDKATRHEYTFTKRGEICFHSEAISLNTPMINFYEFIQEIVSSSLREPAIDDGRFLIKILPELFQANWKSRYFKSMIMSYLIENDLIREKWKGDILKFVLEEMDNISRFLLIESLLEREFNIKQYVVIIK
jgi:hypothetical protein